MSFDKRAGTWDASKRRQAQAQAVADAIEKEIPLNRSMHLLDVGAGTGLLTRRILPHVGKITAVDRSSGMLEKLQENLEKWGDSIHVFQTDIMALSEKVHFDGIISSMTLHHIENTQACFDRLYDLLNPGGFVALADLAPEDGSFHDHGNAGVYHFGFDGTSLKKIAKRSGFTAIKYEKIYRIDKGEGRYYDIFLLTATKPPSR